ncbi:MAG: RNA 2',3'-cyclic phosphodiesterase [Anaerolineales bacterium]|nr:RNA 2',3'-cyclic phosphodiesterase [Anaerolineales bacterium]
MSVIRAFIAINLSPEIYQSLSQVIGQLKERLPGAPIRWVLVTNIHLTVKFLGDVSVSNLELLTKLLRSEASHHPGFEFSVGELGAYPSIRRPRVIWVGVEAPPELQALQRGIEAETMRLGYAREDREFSPHLTLGRISRGASSNEVRQISEVLCNCKVGYLGAARARAVNLYRSDLKPSGAFYSELFSAPLGGCDS